MFWHHSEVIYSNIVVHGLPNWLFGGKKLYSGLIEQGHCYFARYTFFIIKKKKQVLLARIFWFNGYLEKFQFESNVSKSPWNWLQNFGTLPPSITVLLRRIMPPNGNLLLMWVASVVPHFKGAIRSKRDNITIEHMY